MNSETKTDTAADIRSSNSENTSTSLTADAKIRVLLVDDSTTFRLFLSNLLSGIEGIEIVGQATNGRTALPRIRHYRPDLVVLDQEMPLMNGMETLAEIRKEFPDIGVIMLASATRESARNTMRALQMGALDFVKKPPATGDAAGFLLKRLVPRIINLGRARIVEHRPFQFQTSTESTPSRKADICGIGISTGGPTALRTLFENLPVGIKGSLLIVQHMPPYFTKYLADSLGDMGKGPVSEGIDGAIVEPGSAYIAPGGKHMIVVQERGKYVIRILDTAPEMSCRPSVNILFRSIAHNVADKGMGVIMTGMGEDGLEGLREMKQNGCYLVGQSQQSCLVYGMPQMPAREGLLNEIKDPAGIAKTIGEMLS